MAKLRSQANYKHIPSVQSDKTVMTVPDKAMTNTQHLKRVKMGLTEATVKVIFDPDNTFPDIRAMDLVDHKTLLKAAREQVQDIRQKRKIAIEELQKQKAAADAAKKELDLKKLEEQLMQKLKNQQ